MWTRALLIFAVAAWAVLSAPVTPITQPGSKVARRPTPPASNIGPNSKVLLAKPNSAFLSAHNSPLEGWRFTYQAFDIRQVANNKYASQGIQGCTAPNTPAGWPFKLEGDQFMYGYEGRYWNADSECPQITIEQYGRLEVLKDNKWKVIGTTPPAFGSSVGDCVRFVPHEDPISAAQGRGHVEVNGVRSYSFDYMTVLVDTSGDQIKQIVDFNLPNAVVTNKPLEVATMDLNNLTPTLQTMAFAFNQQVSTTKTSSFSSTHGISASVDFETDIPFISDGKISTEVSASFTEGGSNSSMNSQSLTGNFPIAVPGKACYTSVATVTSSQVDVDVLYQAIRNWAITIPSSNSIQTCSVFQDTYVMAHYSGRNCWNLGYKVLPNCTGDTMLHVQ